MNTRVRGCNLTWSPPEGREHFGHRAEMGMLGLEHETSGPRRWCKLRVLMAMTYVDISQVDD
eukprot:1168152-Pyramimonas_sp.AAC.1